MKSSQQAKQSIFLVSVVHSRSLAVLVLAVGLFSAIQAKACSQNEAEAKVDELAKIWENGPCVISSTVEKVGILSRRPFYKITYKCKGDWISRTLKVDLESCRSL